MSDHHLSSSSHLETSSVTSSALHKHNQFDAENPPIPDSVQSHPDARYRQIATFLKDGIQNRRFGNGKREHKQSSLTIFSTILHSLPWHMFIFQVAWTSIVVGGSYASRKHTNLSTLTDEFWSGYFQVSSSVAYGVGWALFVLLGFYIKEASDRYSESLLDLNKLQGSLIVLTRFILQFCPSNFWHPGDIQRIAAHLIAFPIALQMGLRGERDASQFGNILQPDDLQDVMNADSMNTHCLRVVKTYLSTFEPDGIKGFPTNSDIETFPDDCSSYHSLVVFEVIDGLMADLDRIASYLPAAGYVQHMKTFLYIWLFFIPLVLIKSNGWFTFIWSLLITYGVGMIYNIAQALDQPFGYDLQDVKLSQICGETSMRILNTFYCKKMNLVDVIKKNHQTPFWLEQKYENSSHGVVFGDPASFKKNKVATRFSGYKKTVKAFATRLISKPVIIPLIIYIMWVTFIVFLTWGLKDDEKTSASSCRWWCLYLPGDSSTSEFISLGLFMLLGFWVFEAYGRYWIALRTWNEDIRVRINQVCLHLGTMCRLGGWHQRDHQRIFSFLAAVPYIAKAQLRDSRDLSEVEDILSPEDLTDLADTDNMVVRCFDVIFGYFYAFTSAHPEVLEQKVKSSTSVIYDTVLIIDAIEADFKKCEGIRLYPISKSFTYHLQIFTGLWLAILPLSLVGHDGFLTFLYSILIGYSLISLLAIGTELCDPFGYDDEDIPLDTFCDEMKACVHHTFKRLENGLHTFVHEENYSRESFEPKIAYVSTNDDGKDVKKSLGEMKMTLGRLWKTCTKKFPSVPWVPQVLCTIWAFAAVAITRGLSYTWDEARRTECRFWCSPIDVDIYVLGYLGFALFTILGFRASSTLQQYENGGKTFCDLDRHLRTIAMEFVQVAKDGFWHRKDKERLIAHIIQIPLEFRDRLLGIKREGLEDKTGLMCDNDYLAMKRSPDSLAHCIETLESYIITATCPDKQYYDLRESQNSVNGFVATLTAVHISSVRLTIAGALGLKRFPTVGIYVKHQHIFTGVWLFLLPLGISSFSGYFTLILAPIISYGVIGLESLASKLVDPYGEDDIDVPVNDMCEDVATSILQAVSNANWGCKRYVIESTPDEVPVSGRKIDSQGVHGSFQLPHFTYGLEDVEDSSYSQNKIPDIILPKKKRPTQNLLAHVLRSVPWWSILGITVWSIFAVIISYIWRENVPSDEVRWWRPVLTISETIASYVGFATFVLLGFYTSNAFSRYLRAGKNWTGKLNTILHVVSNQFKNSFPAGSWHKADHQRVVAHLASIPLVLKAELRHSKDLSALKGLLSLHDIGRIQCAEEMTKYCIDVVRSYFIQALGHPEETGDSPLPGSGLRPLKFGFDLANLDAIVSECLFISRFHVSPAGVMLLRGLLIIWFFLIPFVLAEKSGGFTVLWMIFISYGLLGVYKVADELQEPFGYDLNDLNLDEMAEDIVHDILYVERTQHDGFKTLVYKKGRDDVDVAEEYTEGSNIGRVQGIDIPLKPTDKKSDLLNSLYLMVHAVPLWILAVSGVWATLMVVISWVVGREFPILSEELETTTCTNWWCSAIAVDSHVKKYSGYALFMLLGIRLYDSHTRYTESLSMWKIDIMGHWDIIAHRIFENYTAGLWHRGDLERIAAYLIAFVLTLAEEVRGKPVGSYRLDQFLSADDVRLVEQAENKVQYCGDVIRGYIQSADTEKASSSILSFNFNLISQTSSLAQKGGNWVALKRTLMPFGYVQHIRIFLVIWIALLPLGLVETSGWLAILWTVIITYSVVGIEHWATELSDPFGTDLSDIPLEKFCEEAITLVNNLKRTYQVKRAASLVIPDRGTFYKPYDKLQLES